MISAHVSGPTPYEEVNRLLHFMLTNVQAILGDRLVGMYLYGSLSLGDFDPGSSDVDFWVVMDEDLPEEALVRLRDMHETIAASELPYAQRLEGSYIPRAALRRYDPDNARHPTIGIDWPFQIALHGKAGIIERYIVRTRGVVVWGPAPDTLIDPVSIGEIQEQVHELLNTFWRATLDDRAFFHSREYLAFGVLTMCRALYTLREGVVASKPQAAAWAQEVCPDWKPMIEQALIWRSDHSAGTEDEVTETLAFLREALAVILRQMDL
jgi:predicted nucleotidyltransferase